MLRGREFTESDDSSGRPVAIVNEAAMTALGGAALVLGAEISVHDSTGAAAVTIVGVAPDIGVPGTRIAAVATIYFPLSQQAVLPSDVSVIVPILESRHFAERAARAVNEELGATASLVQAVPLSAFLTTAVQPDLARRLLVKGTAALAIFLAAIGVFGVISEECQRRRREIGIRLALGSGRVRAATQAAARTLRLVAAGICGGGVLVLISSIVMWSMATPGLQISLGNYLGAAVITFGAAATALFLPLWLLVRGNVARLIQP
jgi:ABC-type antimicrobial peptide transport system permease subunit